MYIERTAHRDGAVPHTPRTSCGCPPRPNGWSGLRRRASTTCDLRRRGRAARGRQLGDGGRRPRREALQPGQRGRHAGTGQIGAGRWAPKWGARRGRPTVGSASVDRRSGRTANYGSRHRGVGNLSALLASAAVGHRRRPGGSGGGARGPSRRTTRTPRRWGWRRAGGVGGGPGAGAVQDLFLSTPDPGYLDKTSATTVHAALGLGRACGAYDFAGLVALGRGDAPAGVRSAAPELGAPTMGVVSDLGRGSPARPRSETAATARRPSSARPKVRSPSWSGGARPATSSSTAGACRARPTPTCGRSGSARRSTCRWPGRPSRPR